ncbi:indolepyruvate ferredoxin oxidoreductase beta subunit [Oscillospiraceae bacterium]|nr:indolepyruvate ferredoxin oxidoreductase beta subunit [Oscillospiraceae bacterium]
MSTNIVLCGVGGQGTVLASKLVAAAAMNKGFEVKSAETIGMAQKGGSVMSHLRIGEDALTPMIGTGEADLIIGFEPSETVRMLPFLKKGGAIITSDRAVMPVTAALKGSSYKGSDMTDYLKSLKDIGKLVIVDTETAVREVGSSKAMNMILLGAASRAGLLGDITHEDIIEAMKRKVKPQFVEMNIRALEFVRL